MSAVHPAITDLCQILICDRVRSALFVHTIVKMLLWSINVFASLSLLLPLQILVITLDLSYESNLDYSRPFKKLVLCLRVFQPLTM